MNYPGSLHNHTDYSNEEEFLGLPKDNEEITYIGITEDIGI